MGILLGNVNGTACENKLTGLSSAQAAFKKVEELMGDEDEARLIYEPGDYIEVRLDDALLGDKVCNVYRVDKEGKREIVAEFKKVRHWFGEDEYQLSARYKAYTTWIKLGSGLSSSSLKWNTSVKYIAFLTGAKVKGTCSSF